MARIERTFSIRTAMLILTVGSGILAIAAALVVGWLSYREYRVRMGSYLRLIDFFERNGITLQQKFE